ncbi:MAG: YdcF family protein [Ruminococcus sp.]|nr:YdcF family protein [Ruminococcus sp.]
MSAKTRPHIRVISFILALCLCVSLAGCGSSSSGSDTTGSSTASSGDSSQTSSEPKRVEKIVEEMAVDYGSYGSEAKDKIDTLLGELSVCDASAGKRWKNIMDVWTSEDLGKQLNYDVLPDGLPDTDELCIVVLGFQLNPDGTMKDELVQRLTVALNSAKKYPKAYIACTGGGTASENESASEAGEMAKWLEQQGIDKKRIIIEDNSITTAQNAIFTYDILTSKYTSVKKLAIVSSDYHIATGELLFRAESILRASAPGNEKLEVVSNAAWKAPSGSLSAMFQAGALIELFGDVKTAFDIYYDNYDIHSLPPLK